MRKTLLFIFLSGLSMLATAQDIVTDTSYYTPPSQRKPRLTPDPDLLPTLYAPKQQKFERYETDLLNRFSDVHSWYIAAEGGVRQDGSQLSNTFSGLISNPATTAWTWGTLIGYTYRNVWTAEFGYTHAPTHLNVTLANTPAPYRYMYKNSGNGLPVRLKWHIGASRRTTSNTGFWLTAGAWLVPNGNQPNDKLQFTGRSGRVGSRNRVDTLQITVNTGTANQITGIAEAGAAYTIRLSSLFELGLYTRKYWGLGNALRSDLTYQVNGATQTTSSILSSGTGWGGGFSLRYVYSRKRELRESAFHKER